MNRVLVDFSRCRLHVTHDHHKELRQSADTAVLLTHKCLGDTSVWASMRQAMGCAQCMIMPHKRAKLGAGFCQRGLRCDWRLLLGSGLARESVSVPQHARSPVLCPRSSQHLQDCQSNWKMCAKSDQKLCAPAMRSMKRSSDASATLSSSAKVSGRTTFSVCGTRSTVRLNTLSVDRPRRYSSPGCAWGSATQEVRLRFEKDTINHRDHIERSLGVFYMMTTGGLPSTQDPGHVQWGVRPPLRTQCGYAESSRTEHGCR